MNFLKTLLCAGAVLAPSLVVAQDYPSKTVTMVVPFSSGGSNDLIGRYLSEKLGLEWGRTVVVENRPGAGAAVGANYVAQSDPDGYTLMFVSGTLTTTGATRRNLPFDVAEDLQPVALGADGKMIIVTGSRLPMPTLQDVVDAAQNGTVFYGTTGVGSITQFAAEIFSKVAGISMEPVHYGGGTDALVDLAGGRIDVYAGTVTQVKSMVDAGRATPVAVSSTSRTDVFPDVPTVAEAGFPGAESTVWWGIFAPAGTPMEIVEKVNQDIRNVMNTEESVAFLATQGAEPGDMTVAEFTEFVSAELANWRAIAEDLDISVE